jgi:hypothetical protein
MPCTILAGVKPRIQRWRSGHLQVRTAAQPAVVIDTAGANNDNGLRVNGNANVTGTLTTNALNAGSLTLSGDVSASNVTATGTVTGNVGAFNSLTSNSTTDLGINPVGALTVTPGTLTFNPGSGNSNVTGTLTVSSGVSGTQLTSTVGNGTAPLVVSSGTLVANLHAATADNLGGNGAAFFLDTSAAAQTKAGGLTVNGALAANSGITTNSLTIGSDTFTSGLLTGPLTVTGAVNLNSTLHVVNNSQLDGTLAVTGTSQLNGAVGIGGAPVGGFALAVNGDTKIAGNTTITGNLLLNGPNSEIVGGSFRGVATCGLAIGTTETCTFTTALLGAIGPQSAVVVQPKGVAVPPSYTVSALTQVGFTLTFSAIPPNNLSFYYVVVE